jgi:hypothetical protein
MKLLLYLLSLSTLIPTIWASDKHDPKEFDFIVVGGKTHYLSKPQNDRLLTIHSRGRRRSPRIPPRASTL